ncbi:MAG: NUDIX hydrolase [Thermoplasmata archaeon]
MSRTSSREYPLRPILSVGAIIRKGGKILIVKRGVEPGKGKWSVPGGAVELGETVEDAVVREAFEESNLKVTPLRLVGYYDYIGVDSSSEIRFHYVIIYWLCDYSRGEARPSSDVTETRWIGFEELDNYDVTKGTLKMIRKVEKEMSGVEHED